MVIELLIVRRCLLRSNGNYFQFHCSIFTGINVAIFLCCLKSFQAQHVFLFLPKLKLFAVFHSASFLSMFFFFFNSLQTSFSIIRNREYFSTGLLLNM